LPTTFVSVGLSPHRFRGLGVSAKLSKNDAGQLGTAGDARSSPAEPVPIGRAVEIAAGDAFACARLADTSIWCWGDCVARETGASACVRTPAPIRW
jgi:alpha-tubulin suppressor-like RCC1 family protein